MRDGSGRPAMCAAGALSCDGAQLMRCDDTGTRRSLVFDCGAVGASCGGDGCRLGDCTFGGGYYHLRCIDNDLALCDGAIRMSCAAWSPGSACSSFAISGEVPTQWCSPSGERVAGVYHNDVMCDGRTIRFRSVSTREYVFDCVANGYVGCDRRGCR